MEIEKLKDSFQRTLSELYEIGGDWTDISTDELKFVIDCMYELEAYRKQDPVAYRSSTIDVAVITKEVKDLVDKVATFSGEKSKADDYTIPLYLKPVFGA